MIFNPVPSAGLKHQNRIIYFHEMFVVGISLQISVVIVCTIWSSCVLYGTSKRLHHVFYFATGRGRHFAYDEYDMFWF